jgi:hypothetical protein
MNIKAEILRVLDQCRGMLVPEPTLLNEVRLSAVPTPTVTEFYGALKELDSGRMVTSVRPQLGGPVKWTLTEAGKAALADL